MKQIAISIIAVVLLGAGCGEKVEVGQVWRSPESVDFDSNDPFGRAIVTPAKEWTVVAISNGYVQYAWPFFGSECTNSCKKHIFTLSRILIKEPPCEN